MAPFYGWGSTASRLEPLRGGSLLFTTKFPTRIKQTSETPEICKKFQTPQPVSEKKYQGLIDLCQMLDIPRQSHVLVLPHGKVILEECNYRDESDD